MYCYWLCTSHSCVPMYVEKKTFFANYTFAIQCHVQLSCCCRVTPVHIALLSHTDIQLSTLLALQLYLPETISISTSICLVTELLTMCLAWGLSLSLTVLLLKMFMSIYLINQRLNGLELNGGMLLIWCWWCWKSSWMVFAYDVHMHTYIHIYGAL